MSMNCDDVNALLIADNVGGDEKLTGQQFTDMIDHCLSCEECGNLLRIYKSNSNNEGEPS